MTEMKQQPTAEDWIILRCLMGWTEDMIDLRDNPTAMQSLRWLHEKLGTETIINMHSQLKQEQQHG